MRGLVPARAARALLLCAVVVAACGPKPDVLATFEAGEVSVERLDALLRGLPEADRHPAEGQDARAWLAERIEDLAVQEALRRRADAEDLAADQGLALRARFVASQQIGRDYLQRLCPRHDVPEEALQEAYRQQVPQEPQPWILVRHIYKRIPAAQSGPERQAARRELEALRARIGDGAAFADLARTHSDSQTAPEGGLIGRLSRQAPIEPRVLEAAWSLQDGEVSSVVEVPNGFHLLLREESGVEEPPPFQQVRERLLLQQQEACGKRILADLAAERPVSLLGGPDGQEQPPGEDTAVLAVGEERFTLGELRALLGTVEGQGQAEPRMEQVRHFAEALLLADAATAASPESAAAFEAALEEARRRLLLEAAWRAERQRLVGERPEGELRAFFEQNPDRFRSDLRLDLGVIVVSSRPGEEGNRPVLERAEALYGRVVGGGGGFEEVAREVSDHATRERGGRLGPLPVAELRGLLGTAGAQRAMSMKPGEVARPVRIHRPPQTVYCVLKLHAREEPRQRTFEEARDDVAAALARERVREVEQEVRSKLLAEIGFKLHASALDDYLANLKA